MLAVRLERRFGLLLRRRIFAELFIRIGIVAGAQRIVARQLGRPLLAVHLVVGGGDYVEVAQIMQQGVAARVGTWRGAVQGALQTQTVGPGRGAAPAPAAR